MPDDFPIHCLGDSHCSFFSGEDRIQPVWPLPAANRLPWFRTYHLGATLAYNLVRAGTSSRGRENLFAALEREVPRGARVMLVFGEIDCRAHLIRQAKERRLDIHEVVRECADRYLAAAMEVGGLGYRVILYNATPGTYRTTRRSHQHEEFASVGTCRQRNEVSQLFNNAVSVGAAAAGLGFLSNFKGLVDRSGVTRGCYYFDRIHLSQRAMPMTLRALQSLIPGADFRAAAEEPPVPPGERLRRAFHQAWCRMRAG